MKAIRTVVAGLVIGCLLAVAQTREVYNIGVTANDGTGDTLRGAFIKAGINESNLFKVLFTNATFTVGRDWTFDLDNTYDFDILDGDTITVDAKTNNLIGVRQMNISSSGLLYLSGYSNLSILTPTMNTWDPADAVLTNRVLTLVDPTNGYWEAISLNDLVGDATVTASKLTKWDSQKKLVSSDVSVADLSTYVDTVADLVALDPTDKNVVTTLGYFAAGDGAGSVYRWSSTIPSGVETNLYSWINSDVSGYWQDIQNQPKGTKKSGVASSLYHVGDSFTFGASATSRAESYVWKLASAIGFTGNNIANGSFMIPDVNWSVFSGWNVTNTFSPTTVFESPASIEEGQTWTALVGFNDLRTSTTSAAMYRKGLDHLLYYLAIRDSDKVAAQSPSASTGTWTPISWGNGIDDIGAYSSSGTLTFSNVIGSEVYLGYIGWATNYGGTISINVDGTDYDSFSVANAAYGNREYISGSDPDIPPNVGPYGDGKLDFCPQLVKVDGLGFGAHTITVTAASGKCHVLWVAGNGASRDWMTGPNVFIGTIPRQIPWSSPATDALHASFNAQLEAAVAAARTAGLRVAVANVASWYDANTMQDGDGIHPDDTGHTAIADAFLVSMRDDSGPFVGIGYQTSQPASGTFSTLTVTGESTLGGLATLGNRLLVLPTATGGGYASRFGYGSVSASGVSMQHSDSTLDRELRLTGNTIGAYVNSTGADAALSIGTTTGLTTFPGTVDINGAATVAQLLTATSGLTSSGVATLAAGLNLNRTSLTSSATLTTANAVVFVNDSSGSVTVGLPAAASSAGTIYLITKTGGSNSTIIDPNGSETINAFTTWSLRVQGSMLLVCDGSKWVVLASHNANPTTRTITTSGGTITVVAGYGPGLSLYDYWAADGDATLAWSGLADGATGTIYIHPASTNVTLTLPSYAFSPSGGTLTVNGGTGSTNHTIVAWENRVISSTNRVSVNASNYYR